MVVVEVGPRGKIRTARRTASDILVAAPKMADLDLPHKSQENCVSRGVSEVFPIYTSILRQMNPFWTPLKTPHGRQNIIHPS